MSFEISVLSHEQCVVARLRGECDMSNASGLSRFLLGGPSDRPARIVVDLSQLDFLDCAGARELAEAARGAALLGGALALAGPTPATVRLLLVSGLSGRLPCFPDLASALAAVQSLGRPPEPAAHGHLRLA